MAARTVYRVRIVTRDYCYCLPPGSEWWAAAHGVLTHCFTVIGDDVYPWFLRPEDVEVLHSAVEFGNAGTHVELGYVFEQHKDLIQDPDA